MSLIKPYKLVKCWLNRSMQTWHVHSMWGSCWHSVADSGPTLNQYWVDVSCLMEWVYGGGGGGGGVCKISGLSDPFI